MVDDPALVIGRIKALASRDDSFVNLLREMHNLAALSPLSMGSVCGPGTKLYRGTNHHVSVPNRIEDIWYPPASVIQRYGRANRPGSSMFYCCSDPACAFLEIGAIPGQYAVLATWVNDAKMILHEVGYSAEVLRRASASRPLPDRHAKFVAKNLSNEAREVREFLSLAFTDPTDNQYRVTAAIAEMLLAGNALSGIMYPAVAKNANVDNLALVPDFVRTSLKLVEANVVLVDEVTGEGISGTVVARLKTVRDGNLVWEYTGSGTTTIPPQSGLITRILPGERKTIASAGQLQINGRDYEVLPGYSIELANDQVIVRNLQGSIVPPKG